MSKGQWFFDRKMTTAVQDSIYVFNGQHYLDPACTIMLAVTVLDDSPSPPASSSAHNSCQPDNGIDVDAVITDAVNISHEVWTADETKFLIYSMGQT